MRLGVAALGGVLLASGTARGDAGVGVRVEYAAAEGCPTRESFIREIGARTSRLRVADESEPARVFRVALGPSGESFRGTLVVVDAGGSESEREVQGESCAVVSSALALVAALTIDPEASTAPLSEIATSAVPPIATVTVTPSPAPPPTARPTPTVAPTPIPIPIPIRTPPLTPKSDGIGLRLGGALGLDAVGLGGPLVGTVFGPALAAEVAIGGPSVLTPSLRLAPEVRVEASRLEAGVIATGLPGTTAQFTWYRVDFDVCPLRLAFSSSIEVRPCFVGVVGAISSEGTVGSAVQSSTQPWYELGGSALLDWSLVGPLGLEAEAGLVGTTLPEKFEFNKPTLTHPKASPHVVFTAPGLIPEARLGLRVRFP